MTKLHTKPLFKTLLLSLIFCLMSMQFSKADEPLTEFECLHLNIGLLSLLTTENTYFKRKDKAKYDEKGGIGQGLSMLKKRGESCPIKQKVYIEAAEYSLHFRKLANAEYFLKKARQTTLQ